MGHPPAGRALIACLVAVALLSPRGGEAARRREQKGREPAAEAAEIDHVALATVMLRDRHFDRAAAVLAEVDLTREELDLPRYWMLYGLVNLQRGSFGAAAENLEAALSAGQADPMVHVFLAQARFGIGDYAGAIASLDRGGAAAAALVGTHLLRSQCHWKMDDRGAAYLAVARGLELHAANDDLVRYKVLLLVDLGLYQAAVEEGTAYLERSAAGAVDHLAISEALIRGGQPQQAVLILEIARLRFPENGEVRLQLARAYMESGRVLTAARLFRQASRSDPGLVVDAAELFRKAGQPAHALYLNAEVAEQKPKIRQRLALLIDLGRFEEAAGLGPRLSRLGLLEEDQVVYALAYALFQAGRFEEAERHLSRIRTPELFDKAMELRRAMARCRAEGWECR
jgi:tetratricopeptide (TPR) repeat protein